jgi:hypothetical protein
MVAVTYDVARVPIGTAAPKAAPAKTAAPRRSWYLRIMDKLIEARTLQAQREIARHIQLLPYSLDERGNRLVRIGKTEMPFGGW